MEECEKTWEKSSDIPPALITEFEHGNKTVVIDDVENRMGQSVHILKTAAQSSSQSHQNTVRAVNQENTG